MQPDRIDAIARSLETGHSRRTMLGAAVAGLVTAARPSVEVAAKKKKGRTCGKRCKWGQQCKHGKCRYPKGFPFDQRWGTPGSGTNQMDFPNGVAISPNGKRVYVADTGNHRIQAYTENGAFLDQLGSEGTGPDQFNGPYALAVHPNGQRLYVSDFYNNRIAVLLASNLSVITHWGPPTGSDEALVAPYGIAVSPNGRFVYVVESFFSPTDSVYRIKVLRDDGSFVRYWGSGTPGSGQLQFNYPLNLAVSPNGKRIYVVDSDNHRIKVLSDTGTFIDHWGTGTAGTGRDQFAFPFGVAVDRKGYVFVADTSNNRIKVLTPKGKVVGIWGSEGSGDRQFNSPNSLAAGPSGRVYVADTFNDRIQQLKF